MTDTIIVGLLAAIPATIAATAALVVSIKGNRLVNGRLTELLAAVGKAQHAAGHAEGVEAERMRGGA